MNKYLKSASSIFEKIKQKDYLINPISEIDCEIITEIVELLKKGGYDDAVQVLKNYKYLKDEEIRDQLIDCNLDFNTEEFEDFDDEIGSLLSSETKKLKNKIKEEIELKTDFITLGQDRIKACLIFGFKTEEEYDEYDLFTGKLIINPTNISVTNLPYYANYTITLYDENEFEETVQFLETQLEKSNIKFVNKDIAEKENIKDNDSGIFNRESDVDQDD